jgi:hypothetical protein
MGKTAFQIGFAGADTVWKGNYQQVKKILNPRFKQLINRFRK